MAGAGSNITGRVVSWGGAANTQLIATGSTPLAQINFDMDAPALPFLPDTSIGPFSAVAGLTSWTAALNLLLKIPQIGNESTVTFANGTVLNADAFTLNITADALPSTAFNASAPTFRSFIPGAFRWRGTWEGYLDNATVLDDIGAAGTDGAATFVYGVNSGDTDLSLVGNIRVEAGSISIQDGTPNRYSYSFFGNGALTHAATTSGLFGNASAVAVPVLSALVLNAGDGTQVSGSAFWTDIGISSRVADFVSVTVAAQGSGDPTLA